jgi:predicted ABC-class ATPase
MNIKNQSFNALILSLIIFSYHEAKPSFLGEKTTEQEAQTYLQELVEEIKREIKFSEKGLPMRCKIISKPRCFKIECARGAGHKSQETTIMDTTAELCHNLRFNTKLSPDIRAILTSGAKELLITPTAFEQCIDQKK